MDNYTILGKGTFGKVIKINDIAVKKIKISDIESSEDNFIIESTICKYLDKTYIVECYNYNFIESEITMEVGLPVNIYLKSSFNNLKLIIENLINAVNYIHSQGIIHLDIKPNNMIIVDNKLKLIDFGSCRYISDHTINKNSYITIWYRPPELFIKGCKSHPSLDIWSTGISIIEIIRGNNPFEGFIPKIEENMIIKIVEFLISPYFENINNINQDDKNYYQDLISQMLQIDPTKRNMKGQICFLVELINIPHKIPKLNDFMNNEEKAKSIGFLINETMDSNFHVCYLSVKILYEILPFIKLKLNNIKIEIWYTACLKLGQILTNELIPIFDYDYLIELNNNNISKDEIREAILFIIDILNYDLRSNDSYLYLYDKINKNKEILDYKLMIDDFYRLSFYDPYFFELSPKIIFETFEKIILSCDLNEEEMIILLKLRETLSQFNEKFNKNIQFEIFDDKFISKLNFYDYKK